MTVTVTVMMMRGPPCVSVGSGGVRGTRSTSAHALAMQVASMKMARGKNAGLSSLGPVNQGGMEPEEGTAANM